MAEVDPGRTTPEILVIDDEPRLFDVAQQIVGGVCERAGVEVRFVLAEDAEQALERLVVALPQAVLIDGLGGRCWEIIDLLQERAVPTVLWTSRSELADKAERDGLPSYLKGRSFDLLRDTVRQTFPFLNTENARLQ